ncbi:Na+/H+ antiporter subunit E [Halorussus salinisoli]|uniref:Na+/H+ antiporter subunit E n=1 Tax=Halorussus salinisoli TaxID=2558242 RepID=UPI001485AD39|nr:Na+/H+ antiporter subunit E [Halorussus salinisoli]
MESRLERTIETFDGKELRTRVDTVRLHGSDSASQTEAVLEYIGDQNISRLIVQADTRLSVERLRERIGVSRLELAPAEVTWERRRLIHSGGLRRLGAIFGFTYLFYLAIGGFVGGLDFLTGAVSAGVTAAALFRIAFSEEPTLARTGRRLGRFVAFLPVLHWEIAKANVAIAYVILHPRLPIDPSMRTVETDTREGLERMVLASSITLTPGTLVVDVHEREFTVHSLTAGARGDQIGGRLQRLVTWVFRGGGVTDTDGGDDP